MAIRKPPLFDQHPVSFSPANQLGLFRAVGQRAIDGDTIDVMIDLGFFMYSYTPIRIVDIDTGELRSSDPVERVMAKKAKSLVAEIIEGKPLIVETVKQSPTFGRFVCEVYFWTEEIFNLSGHFGAIPLSKVLFHHGLDKSQF